MRKKFIFIFVVLFFVMGTLCFSIRAATLDKVKVYIDEGKFEEAIEQLKEILTTDPDMGEAHFLLGRAYSRRAKLLLEEAIGEYREALRDEKISGVARKELGGLLLDLGRYDEVVDVLSSLKGTESAGFDVLKLLGIAYFRDGRFTEALRELEKARDLKPDDVEVAFYLAQIYEDKKLFDEALNSYQKVVLLSSNKMLSEKAKQRIEDIQQKREGITVESIKSPEIKELILNSPGSRDYPEAGAIILLNEHEYIVQDDNTMIEHIHRLIKILNVRGREKYGEVNIDYDSTYQRVKVDFARTIKPDGRIVKVGKKDIRDIDKWAGFPLYSNAKVKVISMPEVVEGSIIEYKTSIFTSKLINKDDFQFSFGIQYFEPCLHHRLRLIVPEDRKINIHYVRMKNKEPKVTRTGNSLVYEWKIDSVPEIILEPNMPPWADISPFIMVSSFKSWDEFSSWWRKLSETQTRPTPQISQKVEEIVKGKVTQEEKAKAIYHWVVSNIRYVGLEFGIAGFKPHSADEIFNNKYGDCKDKATLLIAMYKAAGIPAYYALIGTREMGKLEKDIPMSQFNHAIVLSKIDSRLIWLDPTAETASFGEIPGADQEKLALVFFPDNARFIRVPLKRPEDNMMKTEMVIDINPDASIDVKMKIKTSGATDMNTRSFKYLKPARRKQIVQNWINSIAPGARLKDYNFSNLDDLNIPVELNITFSAPEYLKRAGDVWLFTIPGIQMEAGLVGKEERNYPVVFSTTSLSVDKVEIHLPPQFEVQFVPQGLELELPYVLFKSSYKVSDCTIFYEGVLRRSESKIDTSCYREYKNFMERISRESQQQIIIKPEKK